MELNRQAKFVSPLLGFFLVTMFPIISIAKLGHNRIKYDSIPEWAQNQAKIALFQKPVSTWESSTSPVGKFDLESTQPPLHFVAEGMSTTIESPSQYLLSESRTRKVLVKRAISQRYLAAYRRNGFGIRHRFPDYIDYDNYDYLTNPRFKYRKRNQGRRPVGFGGDYDYDYDYGNVQKRKNQKRNKNKNRKDTDYDSDEEFNDVEPVTVVIRPRQQQTTTSATTAETTTMPSTNITNGTTPGTTTSTSNTSSTGYGYGPYTGNENISIAYGPPYNTKPQYGVPGTLPGTPLSEWTPSYWYDTPNSYHSHHLPSSSIYHNPSSSYFSSSSFHPSSFYSPPTSYGTPSVSYGSPASTYGVPSSSSVYSPISSYKPPSQSYGAPRPSHGAPNSYYGTPSASYGAPNSFNGTPSLSYGAAARPLGTSYGIPSASHETPNTQGSSYQVHQVPYYAWYGKTSQNYVGRRL